MEELENELINLQARVDLLEIDLKDEKGLVKELEKTNHQLVAAVRAAAEEAYFNIILKKDIEKNREDWIEAKIENWINKVEEKDRKKK